jgi:hypothetical protein
MRGTAGARCGLRIGTAWTDEVERVDDAREMPVVVVCVVDVDEIDVSESVDADGPPALALLCGDVRPLEECEDECEAVAGLCSGVSGCRGGPPDGSRWWWWWWWWWM